jgi:hypothetical protein
VFFRRKPRAGEDVVDGWAALSARLELRDASDVAERIRRWLDLGDAELSPLYLLQREGLPATYVYDAHTTRKGPSGAIRRTRRCCLVRSDTLLSDVAFRAWPRQNEVLESLEASRSGAVRVEVPDDAAFDAAVSVFARDAAAWRDVPAPVRDVLARLLTVRGAPDARVVVGERHLLASFDGSLGADLAILEHVLADTLALTVLLPALKGAAARPAGEPAGRVEPATPPGPLPDIDVSISPDDLLDIG